MSRRGRPFKYPRDENNVRIVTAQQTPTKSASTADGDDPSRAKVDQSKTSTFTNISNQIAASNESADSNPALPPGPDQRSAGTFSTGGRASVPSTFSKLQRQQGPINLIEEGPSIWPSRRSFYVSRCLSRLHLFIRQLDCSPSFLVDESFLSELTSICLVVNF